MEATTTIASFFFFFVQRTQHRTYIFTLPFPLLVLLRIHNNLHTILLIALLLLHSFIHLCTDFIVACFHSLSINSRFYSFFSSPFTFFNIFPLFISFNISAQTKNQKQKKNYFLIIYFTHRVILYPPTYLHLLAFAS